MGKMKINLDGGSIRFGSLLAIVFITLKLLGHITWSWWWVLSPLWIPIAIVFSVLVIGLLIYLLCNIFK